MNVERIREEHQKVLNDTIEWTDDLATLVELRRGFEVLREEADRRIRLAVGRERDAGTTWQTIADTLGVSKQAAQQRFIHML